MTEMLWLHMVVPALAATVLMVLDARRPGGVYWAFTQLLPGVAQLPPYADSSVYSEMFDGRSPFRAEFVRRFAWALIPGAYLGLLVNGSSTLDAAAAGLLTAWFVLWPVFFHGLPLANSRRWLLVLYMAVAAMIVGTSVLGFVIVRAFLGSIGEEVASLVFGAVAVLTSGIVIRLAWANLRPFIPWLESPADTDGQAFRT